MFPIFLKEKNYFTLVQNLEYLKFFWTPNGKIFTIGTNNLFLLKVSS